MFSYIVVRDKYTKTLTLKVGHEAPNAFGCDWIDATKGSSSSITFGSSRRALCISTVRSPPESILPSELLQVR